MTLHRSSEDLEEVDMSDKMTGLIAENSKLLDERDELRNAVATRELAARAITAFDGWGRHHTWCGVWSGTWCHCGFDSKKEELRAEQERLGAYGNLPQQKKGANTNEPQKP